MPKRPCAVVLTPDDSKILCADKFGDVYSLPLMGQTQEIAVAGPRENATSASKSHAPLQNRFVPAATSLTVHTKGNREALRQQQKITNAKAEKKALNFDYKLLLGHVSLLTDVACVSMTSPLGKSRDYILTSDRDEHIRVSRGEPQAHIIEGYCLGHSDFVSKLCVLPAYPHLLISGGGDNYLLLWDWLAGEVQQRIDLKTPVEESKRSYKQNAMAAKSTGESQKVGTDVVEDEAGGKLAVSNIIVGTSVSNNSYERHTEIIVTCEGYVLCFNYVVVANIMCSVPALFMFSLSPGNIIEPNGSVSLEGNVLDVVCLKGWDYIVYSMDTIHKPFSTTVTADDQDQIVRFAIGAVRFNSAISSYEKIVAPIRNLVTVMERVIKTQPSVSQEAKAKGRSTKELLYGLESLRKRGSDEQNDIDD